jgi:predicted MFS family arabinose efflux permease
LGAWLGTTNTRRSAIFREKGFVALLIISYFGGYTLAANAALAPYLAADFGLSASEIARMFGWLAIGAIGTLFLTRAVDKLGRRNLLIGSLCFAAALAVATAFAPSLRVYILFQTTFSLFHGAVVATSIVMVTEYLPTDLRARGHSIWVVAHVLGSGMAIILITVLRELNIESEWRWIWGLSALVPICTLKYIVDSLSESDHFHSQQTTEADHASWAELFQGAYRRRSIAVISADFAMVIAASASLSYVFYYLIEVLSLTQINVASIVIGGGTLGILGSPLGARAGDRFGRRNTIIVCSLLVMLCAIGFYLFRANGPFLVVGLLLLFSLMHGFGSAIRVCKQAVTTELFPTRHRATVQGIVVLVAAGASVLTHFCVALLIDYTGSLTSAIIALSLLRISVCIAYMFVPETRGMELKNAALDH